MTWFKADDQLHSHPKVIEAGLEAMGLWVLAGTFCADKRTDGVITWAAIDRLAGGKAKGRKLAKALLDANLWEPIEGGCRFHDWLTYQPSAAELNARESGLSAVRSVAGKKGAQKRWQRDGDATPTDGNRDGSVDGKPDGKSDGKPVAIAIALDGKTDGIRMAPIPDPDPDPKPPQPPLARDATAESRPSPPAGEPEPWELPGHEPEAWARGISDATKQACSAPSGSGRTAILRAIATHCPPVATPRDRARWLRARAREYAVANPMKLLTGWNFEAYLNSPNAARSKPPEAEERPERPYHRENQGYQRPPSSVNEYELRGADALAKALTPSTGDKPKGAVSS
jgi:hypothetical protein